MSDAPTPSDDPTPCGDPDPRAGELAVLVKSIRRIARAVDVHSHAIDRDFGLTLPQLTVLKSVHELGEVTGRAVAEAADLSPATVVGILDKLEAKGLIERYRSTRDRRIVHTRLTDKGVDVLARAPGPLPRLMTEQFNALPEPQRARVLDALGLISAFATVASAEPAPR